MGTIRSSKLHFKNIIRVPHTLSSKASAANSKIIQRSHKYTSIKRNDRGCRENEVPRGPQKSEIDPKLPVLDLSRSQERRHGPSYFQFEGLEPLCDNGQISTHKCHTNPGFLTTGGLALQNRLVTGLFSPACGSQPQTLLTNNLRARTSRDDMFTIWSKHSSQGFCVCHELDRPTASTERHQNFGVFGRLSDRSPGPSVSSEPCEGCCKNIRGARLDGQLREVHSHPFKISDVLGYTVGPMDQSKVSSRRQTRVISDQIRPDAYETIYPIEGAAEFSRTSQLCEFHCAQRQTQLPGTFRNVKQNVKVGQSEVCNWSQCPRKSALVASKLLAFHGDTHGSSVTFSDDRCVRHRMGCAVRQYVADRVLVEKRNEPALQPKRDAGYPKSIRRSRSAPNLQYYVGPERQQNSDRLSPTRRGHKIPCTREPDAPCIRFTRLSPDQPQNLPHPRYLQRSRRSPIKTSSGPRMASITELHGQDIRETRSPGNRPVCIEQSPRCVELRLSRSKRPPSVVSRRIFPDVEFSLGLGFSSPIFNTPGTMPPESGGGHVSTSSAPLEEGLLEGRSQSQSDSRSIHDLSPRSSPGRRHNRSTSSSRPQHDPGDDSSPEDENTISSASLCMSPSVEKSTIDGAPLCASTPMARPLTNGHDGDKRASNCDTLNGNVNVHIVSESTNSMDVLSGGESDAGDTLNRRNNNSISSTLTGTLRENVNDLPKRRGAGDPTYFVAKELLMTERTYKRDLELVTVTWSSKVSGLTAAGTDVVTALARACLALEPLALPAGGLLAKLEKSLATHNNEDTEDPEYKRIAELLYDYLSNTYEAYTSYIERSGTLVGMVESVRRRSTVADKEIASFDATSPLPLTCLLLRPLHRLLHLERLAIELSDATNSSTALKALDIARRAARDASEQLHHVENHAALCQLQRDIVGYDKLLIADREFIRLGCVYKHSTRGLQQRMLFLFSDVLILASKASSSQFRAHAALPLHLLEVKPTELPHSFTLSGEDVNILLSASNDLEFGSWLHALEFAMENAKDNPIDIDTELTPYELEAGVSTSCHSLSGTTSGGALTHVCWHRVTSLSRDHLHLAMRTQMSGYLLRKFKNSHGWQKLWVVFAAFTLFFYKSWQDRQPLASLPLLGYSVGSPAEADAIHKDFVFKLQFKNHIYFFRADSLFTYHRWTDVLQTAMVHSHHD